MKLVAYRLFKSLASKYWKTRSCEKISTINYIGVYGKCRDCGAPVSHYLCNDEFIEKRPAANEWDWWTACDNIACSNHQGEGLFQSRPDWEIQ